MGIRIGPVVDHDRVGSEVSRLGFGGRGGFGLGGKERRYPEEGNEQGKETKHGFESREKRVRRED